MGLVIFIHLLHTDRREFLMKKSIMKKWVAALRSGKYTQARGQLRKTEGFCCLGVLCDLRPQTRWTKRLGGRDKLKLRSGNNSRSISMLPNVVQKWAGMKSLGGKLPGAQLVTRGYLWQLNDIDKMNFNEIADVIEKEWKTL